MKKLLAILVSLLLCTSTAFAEGVDVGAMTTDDLLSLYEAVRSELLNRTGLTENDRIGQGIYIIGKDIRPGNYTFTCTTSGTYDDGSQRNALYIYALGDDGISQGKTLWYLYDTAGNTQVTLSLSEGTILEIWNCAGFLTEDNPSWVP